MFQGPPLVPAKQPFLRSGDTDQRRMNFGGVMKSPLTAAAAAVLLFASAQLTAQVPKYVNFQSVLRDDSGNLVEDGFVDLTFKILDQDGDELYAEVQPGVQVVRSAINVMIGEGVTPGSTPSAPTGGIPIDTLDPNLGSHFLQIQFGPNLPSDPMELGSVPYAMYAERALSFVGEFPVNQIPDEITRDTELAAAIQAHSDEDIATAHPNGQFPISRLDTDIATQTELNSEASARSSADSSEASTRSSADSNLQGQINNLNSTVSNHASRLNTLEGNGKLCVISAYSSVIFDGDDENCRIHAFAVNFGSSGTALAGLASITHINDPGIYEKKDQIHVRAVQDNSPNKMIFIIAAARDNHPAVGGLAIGMVPYNQSCPASEAGTVGVTLISDKGVLADGLCEISGVDITAARSAL